MQKLIVLEDLMKKLVLGLLIAGMLFLFISFNADAGSRTEKQNTANTLTIGATAVPHAELLNFVKEDLEAQGITLRVIVYSDYSRPNDELINGVIDANFSQNLPYMESNSEWKAALTSAFGVHIEPFGLYSARYKNVNDLPNGATIAIPNDPSNRGRALLLLHSSGLITLKENSGLTAAPHDIANNPKNFHFRQIEAALLPRALLDLDAAAINGNFALQAGINPVWDSLVLENGESPFVNIVAVRKNNENNPMIIALKNALLSPKVKNFINDKYSGGVLAIW